MSSPVNDEHHDKRYMYAPPWARENANEPVEAIVAEVEQRRLERQRSNASPKDRSERQHALENQSKREELQVAAADQDDFELALADAIRASKWRPHALDPVTMPEPPKPRLDAPTWAMIARLGGAVAAAAAVALFVTGALRLPSIDMVLGSLGSAGGGPAIAQVSGGDVQPSRPTLVVADASASLPAEAAVAPAQPQVAPLPVAAQSAPAASRALPPSDVLTAFASLDAQPAGASLKAKSDGVQVAPRPDDVRPVDRDELAALIKRGEALLADGDIASARLLLRRAAEAGDGNAALMLAGTYDRAELAKLKVIGVAPDHAQAKAWYTKAAEYGSAEAVRRLQQLAQRPD